MKIDIGFLCATAIFLTTMGCGGIDGSDGSSGTRLQGKYAGVIVNIAPIEFNWNQSGTSISGTVTYNSQTYQYTGTLSGDLLTGNNINDASATDCVYISMRDSEVSADRIDVTGPITIRRGLCNGSRFSVQPGTYDVTKH